MTGFVRRLGLVAIFAAMGSLSGAGRQAPALTPLEQLGKSVFFDQRLSLRGNQSCATCHAPQVGWTGDLPLVNAGPAVYEGSVAGLFGNRKPPTVAYAMAPVLHAQRDDGDILFVGGNFWDGRATGERLKDPIAEQAQGPFVNPVEQALPDTRLRGPACLQRRLLGRVRSALPRQLRHRMAGGRRCRLRPAVGHARDAGAGAREVGPCLRPDRPGRCRLRAVAGGQSVFVEVRSLPRRRGIADPRREDRIGRVHWPRRVCRLPSRRAGAGRAAAAVHGFHVRQPRSAAQRGESLVSGLK